MLSSLYMSVYWTWSEFLTTSIASIQFTVCGRSVNLVNHSPSSMAFCGDRCMIVCITWLPGHKCRWNIYTALWLRPTRSLASSVQLFIMPADTPKCTACGHNARNNPTATSFNARSSTTLKSAVPWSHRPIRLNSTRQKRRQSLAIFVALSWVGSGRVGRCDHGLTCVPAQNAQNDWRYSVYSNWSSDTT